MFRSVVVLMVTCCGVLADDSAVSTQERQRAAEIERGSRIAKAGFRNEDDICRKFNAWQTDKDARDWLRAMNVRPEEIRSVRATTIHGHKADLEVRIRTSSAAHAEKESKGEKNAAGESVQGISVKLVSSSNGFNQIDKRWLKTYARMWKMPPDVVAAMKLYLGESPPQGKTRRANRMYLSELPVASRRAVVAFFRSHKSRIISDLLRGDGAHAADWFMVTLKSEQGPPRWTIRSVQETIRFYSEGDVVMTRYGNLKLGRISMQRKGGDNGRPTANMLQFKLNPAKLFTARRPSTPNLKSIKSDLADSPAGTL